MSAGQAIQFAAPGGGTFTAVVPQGVHPGGTFLVEVAAAPAAAPPVAQTQPVPAPAQQAEQSSAAAAFVPMGLPVDDAPPSYAAAPARPAAPPRAQSYYNCLSAPSSAPPATTLPATPEHPADGSNAAASRPTAIKHAECPICFEPLHQVRASTEEYLPLHQAPSTYPYTRQRWASCSTGRASASRATSSTSPRRRSGSAPATATAR